MHPLPHMTTVILNPNTQNDTKIPSYPSTDIELLEMEHDLRYALVLDAEPIMSQAEDGYAENISIDQLTHTQAVLADIQARNEEAIEKINDALLKASDLLQEEVNEAIETSLKYEETLKRGLERRISTAAQNALDQFTEYKFTDISAPEVSAETYDDNEYEVVYTDKGVETLEAVQDEREESLTPVENDLISQAISNGFGHDILTGDQYFAFVKDGRTPRRYPFIEADGQLICSCPDKHDGSHSRQWSPLCIHEIMSLLCIGSNHPDLPEVSLQGLSLFNSRDIR
jgi:hypothetical protein